MESFRRENDKAQLRPVYGITQVFLILKIHCNEAQVTDRLERLSSLGKFETE